jgi:hypothetical protein
LASLLCVPSSEIDDVAVDPARWYGEFSVPKANGEPRVIRPPKRRLRKLQRSLLTAFYARVRLRSCLHGGVPGHSILSHARAHVGRAMVATLDVRKFFPSTNGKLLAPVLDALGFQRDAASALLNLVLLDGQLPQGAPTSSLLANLAFALGDSRFIRLCRRHGLHYSRYVDDIAVSGDSNFISLRGPFIDSIRSSGYGRFVSCLRAHVRL